MERVIQLTADGSHTVAVPGMHVTYHSIYGAIQESMHVFIESGLKPLLLHNYETIHIFEMGFGSGLNALLTLQQAMRHGQKMYYYAVELCPLQADEYTSLNYTAQLQNDLLRPYFIQLHECAWEKDIIIHPLFTLHKTNQSLLHLSTYQFFNLIYFDAFAPNAQPELWTQEVFKKMFHFLTEKGVLVTYCSKGDVRRAMVTAGFSVEKLSGPPGKREMIRAIVVSKHYR
jgi:tRNA U34 5-methylaminomethyl-2-thiouridine-forming methyltransferase MnmC